jgi:hypothetical protein
MKSLLLALGLFASAAYGDTVTLYSDACTNTKQCYAIPNDAGLVVTPDGNAPILTVDLYGAPGYPYFYVYLTTEAADGSKVTTMYQAAQASPASGVPFTIDLQSFYFPVPTDPTQKTYTGQIITLSGEFHSVSHLCGKYRCTSWSFDGGSIVR